MTGRRWKQSILVSLIGLVSFGYSNSLSGQVPSSGEDFSNARVECLQEVQVECLLVLALSLPPTETSPFAAFDDGSGGRLNILRRLGYLDEANALEESLPATPASLLAEDKFEAAAELLIENQKDIIYEHWSAEDEAIIMIAQEHLRRGDIETAIEVALAGGNGWGNPDAYLMRLLDQLIRQADFDSAEQVAFAMTNAAMFDFGTGLGGPRDKALAKLSKALVDHGQLDAARRLVEAIRGFPYLCEASISLAFAHFGAGEIVASRNALQIPIGVLETIDDQSYLAGRCALDLSNRQLEFGARDAAQISVLLAEDMFEVAPPRGVPQLVPDAHVVHFARLATIQKRLSNHDSAEIALSRARSFMEKIDRPHPNIQAEFWLTYAIIVVASDATDSSEFGPIMDLVSVESPRMFSSDGPIVNFAKALAVHGDFRVAGLIAEHIARRQRGVFPAYLIQDTVLEQLALRGEIDDARQLANSLGLPYERYQFEQAQRWVARAAIAAGETDLARKILMHQMEAGPREPNILMADQKMFGFSDDLLRSYQIHFERSLELPADRMRSQLLYLASEIES